MKTFLLFWLSAYRIILSPFLKNILGVKSFCRFSPSCSEYARMSFEKYGVYRGLGLSIKRLISCQPFFGRSMNYGRNI